MHFQIQQVTRPEVLAHAKVYHRNLGMWGTVIRAGQFNCTLQFPDGSLVKMLYGNLRVA